MELSVSLGVVLVCQVPVELVVNLIFCCTSFQEVEEQGVAAAVFIDFGGGGSRGTSSCSRGTRLPTSPSSFSSTPPRSSSDDDPAPAFSSSTGLGSVDSVRQQVNLFEIASVVIHHHLLVRIARDAFLQDPTVARPTLDKLDGLLTPLHHRPSSGSCLRCCGGGGCLDGDPRNRRRTGTPMYVYI